MTDQPPGSSSSSSPQATDLFGALSARQDAAVERLTQAVAKVLAEAARADAATLAAQVDSLEGAMSRVVREAAEASTRREIDARRSDAELVRSELTKLLATVQRGIVDQLGRAATADAEALRGALGSGFGRVGDRVTEALRSELNRLETALAPPGEVADSVVSAVRDDLLGAVRQLAQDTTSILDSSFAAMRSTLAEVAHDGRAAADAVAGLGEKGVEGIRGDLMAITEALGAEMSSLRKVVESAAKRDAAADAERGARVHNELVVSLGALQESLRSPIEDLAEALGASVQALTEANRAEAKARDDGFAAVQRQIDALAASTKEIADAQAELRRLVGQLWGEEPTAP